MKRTYVIVGSGIGGLISAWRILSVDNTAAITIIERSSQPGGLLSGIVYPNGLYFDIGTHIFQETGLNECGYKFDNNWTCLSPKSKLISPDKANNLLIL